MHINSITACMIYHIISYAFETYMFRKKRSLYLYASTAKNVDFKDR